MNDSFNNSRLGDSIKCLCGVKALKRGIEGRICGVSRVVWLKDTGSWLQAYRLDL